MQATWHTESKNKPRDAMRLNGRRLSNNVDDRRGRSSSGMGLKVGGGIGAIVVAVIAFFL